MFFIYQHCTKLPEDSINIGQPSVHILVLRFLFYAKIVVVDRGRVNWFLLVYTHEGIVYAFDQIQKHIPDFAWCFFKHRLNMPNII